jgi:hypothetical protein
MIRHVERVLSFAISLCFAAACGATGDDAGARAGDSGLANGNGNGSANGNGGGEQIPAGQLTAGEWRDVDHWDFWLELFEPEGEDEQDIESIAPDWLDLELRWGYFTRERYGVAVTTAGGEPAIDVDVELSDADENVIWSARTDNRGHAELFAGLLGDDPLGPLSISARSGDATVAVSEIEPNQRERIALVLDEAIAPPPALDLMFVVDTTGSMGDELRYLQVELGDALARVRDALGEQLELRVSVNFYRDHGDDYVVRSFPFTTNVDEALDQLAAQSAAGGGDYPEAVDEGLADAIHDHDWSDRATARLLFLVLDAPPHEDQASIDRIATAVRGAVQQGVRIIPLAGSGVDKPTEFLMRAFALATGGSYVFLTDDSGIGNPHLEPTVGEYEVELLNDLLVRLIVGWSETP